MKRVYEVYDGGRVVGATMKPRRFAGTWKFGKWQLKSVSTRRPPNPVLFPALARRLALWNPLRRDS